MTRLNIFLFSLYINVLQVKFVHRYNAYKFKVILVFLERTKTFLLLSIV
jgi:hypothetical protein